MCTAIPITDHADLLNRFPTGKCLICNKKTKGTICEECAKEYLAEKCSAIAICANSNCGEIWKIKKTPLEAHPKIQTATFIGPEPNGDGQRHIYIIRACLKCDPNKKFGKIIFTDLIPKSEGN